MENDMPILMTISEAATHLGVPRHKIASLVRRGLIQHYCFGKRTIRLDKTELESNYKLAWERAKSHLCRSDKPQREPKSRHSCDRLEYEMLFMKQDGKCAICGAMPGKLFVDHCHKTGRTRGLLCVKCNLGLGSFRDSRNLLKRAVEYLGQYDFMKEFRQAVIAEADKTGDAT